jgi:hypothetical protein
MASDTAAVKVVHLDDLAWVDERGRSGLPIEMIEAAERAGYRRKLVTEGEGGFFTSMSEFPPGYRVEPHSHDHAELLIIIHGSVTFLDGGPTLGPFDCAVINAGYSYGFVTGPEGMRFYNIRAGKASIDIS